jgi:hypothetical protein
MPASRQTATIIYPAHEAGAHIMAAVGDFL